MNNLINHTPWASNCKYCSQSIEVKKLAPGRDRTYCSSACRVKAHRKLRKEMLGEAKPQNPDLF